MFTLRFHSREYLYVYTLIKFSAHFHRRNNRQCHTFLHTIPHGSAMFLKKRRKNSQFQFAPTGISLAFFKKLRLSNPGTVDNTNNNSRRFVFIAQLLSRAFTAFLNAQFTFSYLRSKSLCELYRARILHTDNVVAPGWEMYVFWKEFIFELIVD